MRELRAFIGQFLIIAALIICVPALLRRIGLTGVGAGFLAFVLIGVSLFWLATLQNRRRRLGLEEAARSFGFYPVERSELRLTTYPLRRAGNVRGVVRGNLRGLETWLFDYEISDGEDSFSQTAVAFPVDNANLPIDRPYCSFTSSAL